MPIHGIFYARFLPQEGTKIVAQSPPGCIVPVAVADESDNGDFDPSHWGGDEGGLPHGQDQHVAGGDTVGSGSDSDGDALDIKATRNKRTRKACKVAAAVPRSEGGSGNDSDALKRSRAAAASASALFGTAASMSSSSVLRRSQLGKPLFDFDIMSEYVIPRPAFFNCYLASRDPSGRYAVLGLPVAIRDSKYDRNEFIFNFGIVVDATTDDQGPYERVVRRLATTFADMEKQNEFLSREERAWRERAPPGGGGIGEVLAAGGVAAGAAAGAAAEDRRRIVPHSPALGAQGQSQSQGSGHNSRAASIGNAGGAASSGPFSQQNYGVTAASAAAPVTDHNGHSPYHRRSIQSLLEIIKEDLNLYGECMIPVDDANTINMKLFPIHPNPPAVEGWHVPVPKLRLSDTVDPSWDLTLQRVIAHMDGVSDVRRIAFEADISIELCRSALRHLLYYDTILLLDIFFFGSCYAPRPTIRDFVANVGGIVDECARYVCLGRHDEDEDASEAHGTRTPTTARSSSRSPKKRATARPRRRTKMKGSRAASHASDEEDDYDTEVEHRGDDEEDDDDDDDDGRFSDSSSSPYGRPMRVSNFDLIRLMTSFCVGRTVTEWLKGHADAGFDVLRYVDVRRLVQFGIIKGCLYRVHKYVVSKQYLASLATGVSAPGADNDQGTDSPHTSRKDPLQKYTDGLHHFDQIMTEHNMTEGELIERLKRIPVPPGDLRIMYR